MLCFYTKVTFERSVFELLCSFFFVHERGLRVVDIYRNLNWTNVKWWWLTIFVLCKLDIKFSRNLQTQIPLFSLFVGTQGILPSCKIWKPVHWMSYRNQRPWTIPRGPGFPIFYRKETNSKFLSKQNKTLEVVWWSNTINITII